MNKDIWRNPQNESSLDQSQTPLWFWNDKLETQELLRQLELKSSVGVTCTTPHARTNGGEGFIGGYLDEEWFSHIQTVLDYKKKHAEPLWLYDEMDWPAGTCNQTITLDENNREKYLTFETFPIPAGTPFRAQLTELKRKYLGSFTPESDPDQYAFNVFIVDRETGAPCDITKHFRFLMFGPELEFQAERDAIAYIVRINVDPYNQDGNAMVNYLDGAVTEKFLASTYDVYYKHCGDYFGDTIQAVFNDETRMGHAFPWCDDLPRVFRERKGYDLMKKLYLLPLDSPEAGRVRCDYFDTVAHLFQTRYFGKLQTWCRNHGIRLFAHLLGEETIFSQARYSGDYLRQNRYLDIPGADHLGKGIGSLNIKFTACGAHSYGKKLTGVEVFAGCGWDMTFEEYIRMVTWMFQQGMQIIINHGFFYSDRGGRKNDWPPSQFFQWQGFSRMAEGNAMIRRLHYAMTGGHNEAEILIYHPMETFWYHYLPDNRYTHGFFRGSILENEKARQIDRDLQLLLNGLLCRNLDFDLLHQDALDNFRVEDGLIRNTASGQSFRVLVLPMCRILPEKALRLCEEFLCQGGTVYAMEDIPAMGLSAAEDPAIASIVTRIQSHDNFRFYPAREMDSLMCDLDARIPHPVRITAGCSGTVNHHPAYDSFLIDPYIHTGEDISGVMFNRYIKDGSRHTLFMNYGNAPETIQVQVISPHCPPTLWDAFTGSISEAQVLSRSGDTYELLLTLPHTHPVILVTGL